MRVRPDKVPEPSQRARTVGVRRPGPRPVAVLVGMTRPVRMTGPVRVTGPVRMASVSPARLRMSHAIQDAWKIRLQHLDNSQPGATANHPQPVRRSRPAR
jgi:hypothetical protein